MDFSAPTLWWILAGLLVAVELATGADPRTLSRPRHGPRGAR